MMSKMYLVSVVLVTVTLTTLIDAKKFGEKDIRDMDDIEDSDDVYGVPSIVSKKQIKKIGDSEDSVDVDSVVVAENLLFEKSDEEPVKRLKRAYYPQSPCDFCGYNRNQYQPAKYHPNSDENYHYKFPSKYRGPSYAPSIYSSNSHGALNNNPSDYPFSNEYSPSYHSPNDPTSNYKSSNYHPSSQQSPNYHLQSYNSPKYQQPNPYSNGRHSNTYPYRSRNGIAPTNLLIGCNPHVSSLPDNKRYLQHSQSFNQQQQQQHQLTPSASYRSHSPEQSSISDSKHPEFNDNSMTNSVPAKDNSTKIASGADAKLQQQETLFKMAQYHDRLIKDVATAGEKLKNELMKAKNN